MIDIAHIKINFRVPNNFKKHKGVIKPKRLRLHSSGLSLAIASQHSKHCASDNHPYLLSQELSLALPIISFELCLEKSSFLFTGCTAVSTVSEIFNLGSATS